MIQNTIRSGARAWLRGELDDPRMRPDADRYPRAVLGAWLMVIVVFGFAVAAWVAIIILTQ